MKIRIRAKIHSYIGFDVFLNTRFEIERRVPIGLLTCGPTMKLFEKND